MENELQTTEAPLIVVDDMMRDVVKDTDFALIHGNVEITRDLALKLFSRARLDYDADPQVTEVGGDVVAIVKAKVWRGERHGTGLGACSLKEIAAKDEGNVRGIHDALAIAETRAYKRALEMCIGLPFINDIIMRLFPQQTKTWTRPADTGIKENEKTHWITKIHEIMADPDFPPALKEAGNGWINTDRTAGQLKKMYDNALRVLDKQQKAKIEMAEPTEEEKVLGDMDDPLPGAVK